MFYSNRRSESAGYLLRLGRYRPQEDALAALRADGFVLDWTVKRLWRVADFAGAMMLSVMVSAGAHTYLVKSPDHHQTFSYGSETQQWITRGPDRHLAISMDFTNDPYVDRNEPRQYDDCVLDFPAVRLSSDGKTFYYHAPSGRNVAVAERYRDFLGISEIRLRSNAELLTNSPHGYLTAYILLESF